ncbi:hypothetical protein VKT23_007455 [Stygiomarasmius scandens]|uniref:Uncharacterized protein n=1 Tax=Marasmiellus scandens TaxID=2682957 RepID=A0ABR1JKV8_9AGAR
MFVEKTTVHMYWTYATRGSDGLMKTYIYHEEQSKPAALFLNLMGHNLIEYWSDITFDLSATIEISRFLQALKDDVAEQKRNNGNIERSAGPRSEGVAESSEPDSESDAETVVPGMTENTKAKSTSKSSSCRSDSDEHENPDDSSSSEIPDPVIDISLLIRYQHLVSLITSVPNTNIPSVLSFDLPSKHYCVSKGF